jgi:hypothetical protein
MLKKSVPDFFSSRVAARVRDSLHFSNTSVFEKWRHVRVPRRMR